MDGIDTNASVSIADLRVRSNAAAPAVAAAQPTAPAAKSGVATATANLISLLADAAPPIDSKKVEAIRSLIAQGRYPIDEHAIAAKMIALDVVTAKH